MLYEPHTKNKLKKLQDNALLLLCYQDNALLLLCYQDNALLLLCYQDNALLLHWVPSESARLPERLDRNCSGDNCPKSKYCTWRLTEAFRKNLAAVY